MSKFLGVAVAGLQVLVLAWMAGEREWVLRTGRTIYLRTAPIDPRDVMRGDYVRLDYELSRVPRGQCRDGLARSVPEPRPPRRDQQVYALLCENEQGLAELVALSDQRPANGLYLRGRVDPWWGSGAIPVRYGLEAYFMQQGRALELERLRNQGNIQVPLEMAVAVGSDGTAVIKDHRWSAVGIGLELQTAPLPKDAPGWPPQPVLAATVRLLNASQNELAIVDLPHARSLALVPDQRWGGSPWQWVGEDQGTPAPQPDHVIVLKPGQVHTLRVDFQNPAWYVVDRSKSGPDAKPQSLTDASRNWSARFRLEYRVPARDACQKLPHAELIWHGRLATRAFAGGRVD